MTTLLEYERVTHRGELNLDDTQGIQWYAVHTGPRMEFTADDNLRRQGFYTWMPHNRVRKRFNAGRGRWKIGWVNVAYFPRYIFVALRAGQSLYDVNETDGVSTIVYFGDEPLPIPHRVMDELMERANPTGIVAEIDMTARKRYKPGDRVQITKGPFAGFIAEVDIDKGPNTRVWIETLGKQQRLVASPGMLAAI